MSNPHNNSLMNVNLINGVAGFAAVGLLQMGFSLLGWLWIGSTIFDSNLIFISRQSTDSSQTRLVTGVMFITTALIHVDWKVLFSQVILVCIARCWS